MLISTVLLYWRLIRCRSELVQPSYVFNIIFILPSTLLKKQRQTLAPPNLLGSDTGLPLVVCLGAELGDNLKALGIVSKLHEQDEVRKVYYMRCHTYAMEARMAWWSHKLDNEAWSHPYWLSLEEKQPLFLEIVVAATGSKVFVHFNGDGIKSNNMATPLGYLAKKASDEQPMAYGSLCHFFMYIAKSSPMFVLEGFEFRKASHICRSAMDWWGSIIPSIMQKLEWHNNTPKLVIFSSELYVSKLTIPSTRSPLHRSRCWSLPNSGRTDLLGRSGCRRSRQGRLAGAELQDESQGWLDLFSWFAFRWIIWWNHEILRYMCKNMT